MGRATIRELRLHGSLQYFNPRPPCGGRRQALRRLPRVFAFQSTPSVGRATWCKSASRRHNSISIHALRGEGDFISIILIPGKKYFNPRPPWGGRHHDSLVHGCRGSAFQSTPSVGRATKCCKFMGTKQLYFNPRPPWGGRRVAFGAKHREAYFNPRPPWGGRQSFSQ